MSQHVRSTVRALGVIATAAVFSLVAVGEPAYAGGRHRHDDSSGFFSLGFSAPAYGYYEPYPAYVYPPGYDYAPGYDPYDNEPMYYEGDYGEDSYRGEPSYGSDSGSYCREFQTTIVIDGRPERAFGTACLQPDGSWAVVN